MYQTCCGVEFDWSKTCFVILRHYVALFKALIDLNNTKISTFKNLTAQLELYIWC